ncbi:MAG: penicillin acylase family protein, partial [Opitutaceae bacterium]|nr:penicillin acylase family protein [Opitutaceae bacterium]
MSDATIVTLKAARRRHRRLCARVTAAAICVLVIAAFALSWRFHRRMEASLPQLDGAAPLAGLSADATVTRDALGVPAINAATRPDAARALGFLHAQDRFFQMDLTRRRAAGELSALFGKKTLAADKAVRIHGLRAIAQKSLALLPAPQRALLDAYAAGVNTGLAQLREPPFEYLLLGEKPRPWLPEDSILVIHAMALDLQHSGIAHERMLGAIRDCYDNNVLAYFAPPMSPDDSPFDGKTAALPPIPKPSAINLRADTPADAPAAAPTGAPAQSARAPRPVPPVYAEGSNSMAVAGKHHGPGIIENDMHLTLRVPGAWYRVSMQWHAPDAEPAPDVASAPDAAPALDTTPSPPDATPAPDTAPSPVDTAPAPGATRSPDQSATRNPSGRRPQSAKSKIKITGITHPGAPVIIAGSNGKIAWGFTNAYAD